MVSHSPERTSWLNIIGGAIQNSEFEEEKNRNSSSIMTYINKNTLIAIIMKIPTTVSAYRCIPFICALLLLQRHESTDPFHRVSYQCLWPPDWCYYSTKKKPGKKMILNAFEDLHGPKATLAHHWSYYPLKKVEPIPDWGNHYCWYPYLPSLTFCTPYSFVFWWPACSHLMRYKHFNSVFAPNSRSRPPFPLTFGKEAWSEEARKRRMIKRWQNKENMMLFIPYALTYYWQNKS